MIPPPFSGTETASAVLTLIKSTWRLGSWLSKLDQDTHAVDNIIRSLTWEVKSLGNECDLIYAELEEITTTRPTRSPYSYNIDPKPWSCLATQIEETSRTLQELETLIQSIRGADSTFVGQCQRQLDQKKDQIADNRIKVRRHTDYLHVALLLIRIIIVYIAPRQADRGLASELEKLQDIVEKLQGPQRIYLNSTLSHTEAALLQSARNIILNGTTLYESKLKAESAAAKPEAAQSTTRVAEWVGTLDSIRRERRSLVFSEGITTASSMFSENEAHTTLTSATSEQYALHEGETGDAADDESEDDLSVDLTKAALETGTSFFEAQQWEEADALFQEALRLLQQLPKRQRVFCDTFHVRYRLAVCAYHLQEPMNAEEALISVTQESAVSDEQRVQIYHATHLVSLLYIRMSQLDRARSECAKALQARRRLLGKHSDASFESTALMAHIYVLLGNRARARSCFAMIPDTFREAVLRSLEKSLGTKVERLETSAPPTRPISEDPGPKMERIRTISSISSLGPPANNICCGSESPRASLSSATSPSLSQQRSPSYRTETEGLQAVTVASFSSAGDGHGSRTVYQNSSNAYTSASPELLASAPLRPTKHAEARSDCIDKPMSRKDMLDKIGCQPRDSIEEAVCDGNHLAFTRLLNKKKDSWRSKLRKRSRPERVTALHFAALFGEIDMARRLLAADFNVNEVPFGYSTELTPLKFAIGARQVEMVEFLIAYGAKPSEPDSWSTMAGQLMNRSWLEKTMSESEREHAPSRMIAILKVLIKHGWNINAPFEKSGRTVLHQAVGFWTGSYKWDLSLRAAITAFLCEHGADPSQPNAEGKTPYDIALASGDQDLLLILGQDSKNKNTSEWRTDAVELAA